MLQKGQGAIEYLLIIAAAVLVVAIVIIALTGALEGGQDQTAVSEDTTFDAFHDLRVTGFGYKIEVEMADGASGNNPYKPFPVDETTDCNSPITGDRIACFYTPTIVQIKIDNEIIEEFDMTNKTSFETYKVSFKADPNIDHKLQIYYQDCWAGWRYATAEKINGIIGPLTYISPLNASNVNTLLFDPTFNDNNLQLQNQTITYRKSVCSDNKLWDKNLKINTIKITNSDGEETLIEPRTYWSGIPAITFK